MGRGPVGVAVVGAGVISDQYLANLSTFPDLRLLGVADLDVGRAREQAAAYGIPEFGDVDAVLGIPEVEIVVNLTVPAAHAEVARAALRAGKHVYGEKPLVVDRAEGKRLLVEAATADLRIGCAPDTFLGAGFQSAQRAIGAGVIGEPVAAITAVMNPGPDRWHPNPEFLFARGGGPVFDLGPYYLTALVALLGPVARVSSAARRGRDTRTIGSGPRQGQEFTVEVATHVSALLEFRGGVSAVSTFSFDSWHRHRLFEVLGTEGTLAVPDPNSFQESVQVMRPGGTEWEDLPVEGDSTGRGMGVLDMARSLRAGTPHRASGEMAQHVLDLMTAMETGDSVIDSAPDRPESLPTGWDPRVATL